MLHPDDPLYRGVQIPLRFFKVAAFLDAGDLAATGYVLDQTLLVQDLLTVVAAAADRCSYGCQGRLKRCWAACRVVPSTVAMELQVAWCCRARVTAAASC